MDDIRFPEDELLGVVKKLTKARHYRIVEAELIDEPDLGIPYYRLKVEATDHQLKEFVEQLWAKS